MPDRRDTPPVAVPAERMPAPGRPAGREHDLAEPEGDHHALPGPTVWPMTLAGGVTLLAAGVATSYFVSAAGLVLMVLAILGWVRDLQAKDQTELEGAPDE